MASASDADSHCVNTRDVQAALNDHGFPCSVDGVEGPQTKLQINRFQQAYCGPGGWLDVDGVAGPQTIAALQWTVDNNALVSFFSIQEVACNCGCAYVKRELLSELFKLRQAIGPVSIACAYRCEKHNAEVGGASNSTHPQGLGADPTNVTKAQVKAHTNFTGIGSPDGVRATHVDARPGPRIEFYDKSTG
jgi:peptidoglycan hydrolase-like protein with peptidoglycan-binding domain